MNKVTAMPAPADKTLQEQKSDFTAEGSPPPGRVAASRSPAGSERVTTNVRHSTWQGTITLKRKATDGARE